MPASQSKDPYCKTNGFTYQPGSIVCINGSLHVCDDGSWKNLQTPCKVSASGTIEIEAPKTVDR